MRGHCGLRFHHGRNRQRENLTIQKLNVNVHRKTKVSWYVSPYHGPPVNFYKGIQHGLLEKSLSAIFKEIKVNEKK